MRKWLLEIGLSAFLATALAAPGAALAQGEGEEEDPLAEDEFGEDEFGEDEFGEEEGFEEEEAAAEEEAPAEAGAEGRSMVVLPKGGILVYAPLEINLSDEPDMAGMGGGGGGPFEPTSLAPDVWYGVTPELSAGLVHSTLGTTGFHGIGGGGILGNQGAGICFTGEDGGCPKFYNNVGLDARYLFMPADGGPLEIAAEGGLFANTLDPFALALKAGIVGVYRLEGMPLHLQFEPNLFIGLTERDFNKTVINLPVSAHYMLNEQLSLMAQTGIRGPVEEVGGGMLSLGFGDLFRIPLTVGGSYGVNENLHVFGAFTLLALIGGDAVPDGFEGRSLTAGVLWMQ